jgi:hypothetical protein
LEENVRVEPGISFHQPGHPRVRRTQDRAPVRPPVGDVRQRA